MKKISSFQFIRTGGVVQGNQNISETLRMSASTSVDSSEQSQKRDSSCPSYLESRDTSDNGRLQTEADVEEGNTKCMVCWERAPDCILLECGHCGLCVQCADQLWKQTRRCPLCRGSFAAVMQIVSCDASTVSAAFPLCLYAGVQQTFVSPSDRDYEIEMREK